MAVTNPYQLTVLNHTDGRRYSFAGTKEDCEKEGAAKKKEWKGDDVEATVTKR